MNSVSKIQAILTRPRWFFSHLKEKSLAEAFQMYAIGLAVSVVLGTIIGLIMTPFVNQYMTSWLGLPVAPSLSPAYHVAAVIFAYIFGLVASFVVAGIIYVWVNIFGGKANYVQTYQLYAYSKMPHLLLSWIPGVSFFAWIYSLALLIIGTNEIHKISMKRSVLIYVIPVALFALLVIAVIFLLIIFASSGVINAMQIRMMHGQT